MATDTGRTTTTKPQVWPEGVTCSVSPRATVRGKITEYKIHESKDGTVSADLVLEETGGQQVNVLLQLPANARKERLTVAVERAAALPVIELTGTLLIQRAPLVEAVKAAIQGGAEPLNIMAQTIETDTADIWGLGMPPEEPWTKKHTVTITMMVPDNSTMPNSLDLTEVVSRAPYAFVNAVILEVSRVNEAPKP